jgi:hypothetical protein
MEQLAQMVFDFGSTTGAVVLCPLRNYHIFSAFGSRFSHLIQARKSPQIPVMEILMATTTAGELQVHRQNDRRKGRIC